MDQDDILYSELDNDELLDLCQAIEKQEEMDEKKERKNKNGK